MLQVWWPRPLERAMHTLAAYAGQELQKPTRRHRGGGRGGNQQ